MYNNLLENESFLILVQIKDKELIEEMINRILKKLRFNEILSLNFDCLFMLFT